MTLPPRPPPSHTYVVGEACRGVGGGDGDHEEGAVPFWAPLSFSKPLSMVSVAMPLDDPGSINNSQMPSAFDQLKECG